MKTLRTYLFATTSYAVLIGSASAADMALKAPPPPAAVSNWTGTYVGADAGVALDHSAFTDVDQFFFILGGGPNNTFWTPKRTDFTGGILAGYNLQLSKFVLGLEGDLSGISGRHTTAIPTGVAGGTFASTKVDWMSTVRARAGILIDDATLLYATGGVAFTHFSDSWGDNSSPVFQVSTNYSRTGAVYGGGVERMFAPHWTARVEALHADFGTYTTTTVGAGQTYRTKFEHDTTMVRGALTYKW